MVWKAIAVGEDDSHGAQTLGVGLAQCAPRRPQVQRPHDPAGGFEGARYLGDLRIEELGQDDLAREDVGALLVADADNRSAKPAVISSRVGSPLCSSSALVASVVPIRRSSITPGGMGSCEASPSRSRMPWSAASA